MAATIASGNSGAINTIGSCAEWTITDQTQVPEGVSSSTKAAPVAVPGNTDWLLKFRTYGKVPLVYPGSTLTFVGYTGTGSWSGNAIIEKARLTAQIAESGILVWDIEAGGSGVLTPGATTVTDATSPTKYSSALCKAQWAGSDINGLQGYTLELSRQAKTYAQGGAIYRLANSGINRAAFTLDLREADPTVVMRSGAMEILKLFVDGSTFFQLGYGVMGPTEHNVPIETGDIVPVRHNGTWSGWKNIAGTMTKGSILKPDTTTWWT